MPDSRDSNVAGDGLLTTYTSVVLPSTNGRMLPQISPPMLSSVSVGDERLNAGSGEANGAGNKKEKPGILVRW